MSFSKLAMEAQGQLSPADSGAGSFRGVAIDSRVVRTGELFIAVRGERNDGHEFIDQALQRGAAGVMIDERFKENEQLAQRTAVVVVRDTHEAMIQLAQKYRRQSGAKIIGITGSNGKTTTKEYAYSLLRALERDVYRSPGNFNNLFGAPLALFAMPRETKLAVLEMGISTKGEMAQLTQVVSPDLAVITNVGPSHLEFLSTVEDVARAKLEIVAASPNSMRVVVNADDELLLKETRKIRNDIVTFAVSNQADYSPSNIEITGNGESRVTIDGSTFILKVAGRHQVYNLLAAYAACRTMGYDFRNANTTEIELNPAPMRGETVVKNSIKIINDAYNANPDSVRAGLEAFESLVGGQRRIIILGDMLELGDKAEHYHQLLGGLLRSFKFDLVIAVGALSGTVVQSAVEAGIPKTKLCSFADSGAAARDINDLIEEGDLIYVKGSRGVGLEKIIERIGSKAGKG